MQFEHDVVVVGGCGHVGLPLGLAFAETGLDVLASVEPIVRSGIEGARSARTDAVERSRKAGRRARKTTKRTLRRAKVTASSAKDAAAPHAERLAAQVGAVVDHLTVPDS